MKCLGPTESGSHKRGYPPFQTKLGSLTCQQNKTGYVGGGDYFSPEPKGFSLGNQFVSQDTRRTSTEDLGMCRWRRVLLVHSEVGLPETVHVDGRESGVSTGGRDGRRDRYMTTLCVYWYYLTVVFLKHGFVLSRILSNVPGNIFNVTYILDPRRSWVRYLSLLFVVKNGPTSRAHFGLC